MSTIVIDKVSRWYGNVVAVNDVTMEIGPGVTGLLGPNGAGKSTLISMMAGFLPPSAGTVTIDGEPTWRNEAIYYRIGLVPEREGMYDVVSGWGLVLANAKLHKLRDAAGATRRALETVDMVHAQDCDIATALQGDEACSCSPSRSAGSRSSAPSWWSPSSRHLRSVLLSALLLAEDPGSLAAPIGVAAAVAVLAYCALFLLSSTLTRNAVLIGLLYAIVWETTIANLVPGAQALSAVRAPVVAGPRPAAPRGRSDAAAERARPVGVGAGSVALAMVIVASTVYAGIRLRTIRLASAE